MKYFVGFTLLVLGSFALAQQATPFSQTAVFLLDASMSSDTRDWAGRIEQMQAILAKDASIKKFNVLVFDVAGRWLEPKGFLPNDAENRERVGKKLAEVVPEGACDVAAALQCLQGPMFDLDKGANLRVFVFSEGWINLGESNPAQLVARFRARCPYRTQFACLTKKPGGGNVALLNALETPPAESKKVLSSQETFHNYLEHIAPRVKLFEGKNAEHVQLLIKALTEKDCDLPAGKQNDKITRLADVPKSYLDARAGNLYSSKTYLDEALRRGEAKDNAGLARVLTSLLPLFPTNFEVQRAVGYRLLDAQEPGLAIQLFERIQEKKPEEPHSYRDLARGLEDAGLLGLAAIQYEILLAGKWDSKYTTSFKEVVQEEYAHMMRDAIRRKTVSNKLIDLFGERLESFDASKLQADLRVTISWNTDNTDVDLWVIEPGGEKCFYGHRTTSSGGELTQDVTQGYGPERYQMVKAKPGEYLIAVHFFSGPRNQQVVEGTHVNVVVRRNAGTPQEESQRYTVILRQRNDLLDVVRMKF